MSDYMEKALERLGSEYIESIGMEVGGGGDTLTEIHLRGGGVIFLAYGMIGVYSAKQWAEFQAAAEDGGDCEGPLWQHDNVFNLDDAKTKWTLTPRPEVS